ncbi:MAG: hypothetical protein NWF01_11820 [Candidatus Bathyarchaeota archaeon]|nr:hypothetical protein [Candidatus Bathyarchaeota archaeon]
MSPVLLNSVAAEYFTVNVESPIEEATYYGDSIIVKINVTYPATLNADPYIRPVCYLDGQLYDRISLTEKDSGDWQNKPTVAGGEIILKNLTQGEHTITINGTAASSWFIVPAPRVYENLTSINASFFVDLTPTEKPTQQPQAFTSAAIFIGAVIVVVILAAVSLLIYRKKTGN